MHLCYSEGPPYVTGDGHSSIKELFDKYIRNRSADPQYKSSTHANLSDKAVLTQLDRLGLSPSSALPNGAIVFLRSNANISTGGFREDVTNNCHPDNILLAERAARIVGLDNAGIDFITEDISRSWIEVGGGICEVNPTPAFSKAKGFEAFLDYLFPKPRTGRVPIVLLLGEAPALQSHRDDLIKEFIKHRHTYGYIYDRKLNVCSSNDIFVAPGEKTQDLLIGLLSDELVEGAFIQLDFEEMKAGLDLHYIDLLVATGAETEMSLVRQSDLIGRCNSDDVLINPSLNHFKDGVERIFRRSSH